jgi:hypothetical protein
MQPISVTIQNDSQLMCEVCPSIGDIEDLPCHPVRLTKEELVKVKQIRDECERLNRLATRDVKMRNSETDIESETFPNRADMHSEPPCTLEKPLGEERHNDRLYRDDENSPV